MGRQLSLEFKTRGGARKGAGRKAVDGKRACVSHHRRPIHEKSKPVHVTTKILRGVVNLRLPPVCSLIKNAIREAQGRKGMHIVHFSVQHDHIHAIVEAEDSTALARGMQGLNIRIARAINGLLDRTGKVFADKFHSHELLSRREVRNALAYVLLNRRKHAVQVGRTPPLGIDPCSSGFCFDGWREKLPIKPDSIVAAAGAWLLRAGWKLYGLISITETPSSR